MARRVLNQRSFAETSPSSRSEPPREVLGAGLDGEVDAVLMRREEQRRRPGVVHQHHRAVPVRHLGDRRNVLHLEGLRARRLGEDGRGVRAATAPRCRRRSAGRNRSSRPRSASARVSQKIRVGRIDAIRHQEVVAGLEAGHQRERDGGEARGREHRAGGAGERRSRRSRAPRSSACPWCRRCSGRAGAGGRRWSGRARSSRGRSAC